jgi:hypothetical protein
VRSSKKLDEIAIAISELVRYVEDLEKESVERSQPHTDPLKSLHAPDKASRRSLARFAT